MVLLSNMVSTCKKILVIVGPTASGKSNFGVLLAKKVNGEIISADSRQIYKNLDIGSGKITKKEMGGVKHYCLNIANPKKIFTAYDFVKCARRAMKKICKKGKIPIIIGGTGFYIDAAVGKIELSNVPPNPKLRKKLSKYPTQKLFSILKKLDQKRAEKIDRKNRVRLVRAIEIAHKPHPLASLTLRRSGPAPLSLVYSRILWLGIKRSKEDLKKRIHKRLVERIPGIIKEVKKLRDPPTGGGISWKRLFDLGLEYRYVSLYIRKKLSKDKMLKKLESEINKYAKRQMTYWKRNKEIKWLSMEQAKKLGQQFLLA